ncbi:MAG: AzlD domain-containing protein [Lachnospiraceae bacterium]|nr:AzlD domain-containing protein [Lachnospiraceae bacterium]
MDKSFLAYLAVMALITYLIRALPLVLVKKKIGGRFLHSFLYYVPYVCLAAMTFPAILTATGSYVSGAAAFAVALLAAVCRRGMFTVALLACLAAFLTGLL